jgi:hypothetical protein
MEKPIKIVFGPHAFDGFDGTQEELDELIKLIQEKVADGSFFDESEEIDPEDLSPELRAKFEESIAAFEDEDAAKKKLN